MARELSEKEQNEYNKMIQGAKQLNLFGEEEELDARDFIIDRPCETEDEM
ncbi:MULTISPECIES: hypothetical protein [unclassified Butyrivibrio]|nr:MULTISPECIES: hypothetical protein [unclassified Butyrivibrio]